MWALANSAVRTGRDKGGIVSNIVSPVTQKTQWREGVGPVYKGDNAVNCCWSRRAAVCSLSKEFRHLHMCGLFLGDVSPCSP